jgi:hypothetical protein
MCEFVEAMNPGLHLSRKPEVLKDRDLSGELKDVWNAVQSMREKQKFEGGHNMTSDNLVVYTEFGPPPPALDQPAAPNYEQSILQLKQQQQQEQIDIQSAINTKNNTNLNDSKVVGENHDKTVADDLSNLKLEAADEADSNKLIENALKPNGDKEAAVNPKTPTHTVPQPQQPAPLTSQPVIQTPPTNNSSNNSSTTTTTTPTTNSSNQSHKKEKDSNVTSSHPFQFMFRSSKSSHHHNNDDDASKKEKKELLNNSNVSDKTDKEKEQVRISWKWGKGVDLS